MPLDVNSREPDDDLHNPDPRRDYKSDRGGAIFTARGIVNLGCLFFLFCALVMLLYVVLLVSTSHLISLFQCWYA